MTNNTRNDGSLYTGLTSANFRKQKVQADIKKQAKKQKQTTLMPAYDLVMAELDKDEAQITTELLETISISTPKDDVKSLIIALNMYQKRIKTLRSRIRTIMTVTPVHEKPQEPK